MADVAAAKTTAIFEHEAWSHVKRSARQVEAGAIRIRLFEMCRSGNESLGDDEAQKAASIAPARDRPWPVSALVLLTFGRAPLNTAWRASASERSPAGVEVAWALT